MHYVRVTKNASVYNRVHGILNVRYNLLCVKPSEQNNAEDMCSNHDIRLPDILKVARHFQVPWSPAVDMYSYTLHLYSPYLTNVRIYISLYL